jgi:hypothetical protein
MVRTHGGRDASRAPVIMASCALVTLAAMLALFVYSGGSSSLDVCDPDPLMEPVHSISGASVPTSTDVRSIPFRSDRLGVYAVDGTTNAPIPGVQVVVHGETSSGSPGITDAEGRFTFDLREAAVDCSHEDYFPVTRVHVESLQTIRMWPRGVLVGQVVDDCASPVPSAQVQAVSVRRGAEWHDRGMLSYRTNPSGQFRVPLGVDGDAARLRITHPGFLVEEAEIESNPYSIPRVAMRRGCAVKLRVIDRDRIAAAVEVTLVGRTGVALQRSISGLEIRATPVERDIRVGTVAPGVYDFRAESDMQVLRRELGMRIDDDVTIDLPQGTAGSIAVTVDVTSVSGDPLADAIVRCGPFVGRTAGDGRVEIVLPRDEVSDVAVERYGHMSQIVTRAVRQSRVAVTLEAALPALIRLRGWYAIGPCEFRCTDPRFHDERSQHRQLVDLADVDPMPWVELPAGWWRIQAKAGEDVILVSEGCVLAPGEAYEFEVVRASTFGVLVEAAPDGRARIAGARGQGTVARRGTTLMEFQPDWVSSARARIQGLTGSDSMRILESKIAGHPGTLPSRIWRDPDGSFTLTGFLPGWVRARVGEFDMDIQCLWDEAVHIEALRMPVVWTTSDRVPDDLVRVRICTRVATEGSAVVWQRVEADRNGRWELARVQGATVILGEMRNGVRVAAMATRSDDWAAIGRAIDCRRIAVEWDREVLQRCTRWRIVLSDEGGRPLVEYGGEAPALFEGTSLPDRPMGGVHLGSGLSLVAIRETPNLVDVQKPSRKGADLEFR